MIRSWTIHENYLQATEFQKPVGSQSKKLDTSENEEPIMQPQSKVEGVEVP
jgi:hypothetical protein